MGNYDIADVLNMCGFPTLTGKGPWLGQTIYKMLQAERPDLWREIRAVLPARRV